MSEPSVVGIILVSALVVLLGAALCAVLLALRRTRRELAATRHETDELHYRLDRLAEQVATPATTERETPQEFVITELGQPGHAQVEERIDGRLFADIVLRETVVRAAALTHGVRRALAPESRNRIRFEMKREVKRSRKQRRADTKAAIREWEARQRAELDTGDAA
ncbi:conserved exported hypothetical protein [metagenome]|uniref:Uncharacterized protein n=1 Tax=metagenome TaxID=256318 RepID=A0A2P2BY82_9ZZZZ